MKKVTQISLLSLLFWLGTIPLLKAQTQTHTSPDKAVVINSFPSYHQLRPGGATGGSASGMGGLCHTLACCSVWVYRVDIPVAGSLRMESLNFTALATSMIAYKANKKNPTSFSDLTYVSGHPGNFCGFRDSMQLGYSYTWSHHNRTAAQNAKKTVGWRTFINSSAVKDTIGPGSYYVLAWSKNQQTSFGSDTATFVFRFEPYCTKLTATSSLSFDSLETNSGTDTLDFWAYNNKGKQATIKLNQININSTHAADYKILTQPKDSIIADGDSVYFKILFAPKAGGDRVANLEIPIYDSTCGISNNISLSGYGNKPQINVLGNGVSITKGASTPNSADFTNLGLAVTNSGSVSKQFSITNTGNDTLVLSANPLVSISGSTQFTITSQPTATLLPRASTNFSVQFTPASDGFDTATVRIISNDIQNDTFTFSVMGAGGGVNGLHFDGSNDHVKINDVAQGMADIKTWTIEAWVKTDGNQTGNDHIVAAHPSSGTSSRMLFRLDDGDLDIYDGSTAYEVNGKPLDDGKWHHVAVTYNNRKSHLYIDGVYQETNTLDNISFASTDRWSIGQEYDGNSTSEYWKGGLNEIRIWKTERTEAQIANHRFCELSNPASETDLVAYYTFNQGTAKGTNTGLNTLADLSANGFDGTLTNFALTGSTSNFISALNVSNNCSAIDVELCDASTYTGPSSTVYDSTALYVDVKGSDTTYINLNINYTELNLDNFADAKYCDSGTYAQAITTGYVSPLTFNGSDKDWVEINDVTDSLVDTDRSIFMWIKTASDNPTSSGNMIGINGAGTSTTTISNFLVSSRDELAIYDGANFRYSGVDVADQTWHHVGYTYNETTNLTTFWIDGQAVSTFTNSQSISAGNRISLGQEFDGTTVSDNFDGQMVEVSIWNALLDSTDIAQIRAASVQSSHGKYNKLVAYYPGADNCGDNSFMLRDYSGNNYHGSASATGIMVKDTVEIIDGFDASSLYNFTITKNGSLVSTNKQPVFTSTGTYVATFSRAHIVITDTIVVEVNPTPTAVIKQSSPVYYSTGDSIKLSVDAVSGVTHGWFRDNKWSDANTSQLDSGTIASKYVYQKIAGNGDHYLAYLLQSGSGSSSVSRIKVYKLVNNNWVDLNADSVSSGKTLAFDFEINAANEPVVAYNDFGNSGYGFVKKYDGSKWVAIGGQIAANKASEIALGITNDTLFVAYGFFPPRAGDGECYVTKFKDTSWVQVGQKISVVNGEPDYLDIKVINGQLVLSFNPPTGSPNLKSLSGATWQNFTPRPSFDGYTDIYVAKNGDVYATYSDNSNSGKLTVEKLTGSSWSVVGSAGFTPGSASVPSLAEDNNGDIIVSFKDASIGTGTNYPISVMTYKNAKWQYVGAKGSIGANGSYSDITVNSNNDFYVLQQNIPSTLGVTIKKYSRNILSTSNEFYSAQRGMVYIMNSNAGGCIDFDSVFVDTGAVSNPEIMVLGNGIEISSGSTTIATNNLTDFGSVDTNSAALTKTFYIKNTGTDALTLSGTSLVAVSGSNASDFSVNTQPSSGVSAGDSSAFVLSFLPTTTGAKSATITIVNNDSDEGTYTFAIGGTGAAITGYPEIALWGNSVEIASGSTTTSTSNYTDFGSADTNSTATTKTFYVKNSGTASLTLSGSSLVALGGTNASDFNVNTQPSGSIAVGDSSAFVISFLPTDVGTRTATVTIANNDSNEGTYTFAIQGTGNAVSIVPRICAVPGYDTLQYPLQATWLSGSKNSLATGHYGSKGTGTAFTTPAGSWGSVSWMDTNGVFYLFGGGYNSGGWKYRNDLWKWDGSKWSWLSGDSTTNESGIYGTKGVAAAYTKPGARYAAASYIDSNQHLWLFGGSGYDSKGSFGYLNDLWKWDGTSWTWVSGDSIKNQYPDYGTAGIAAGSNKPGGANGKEISVDSRGNAWMYGGTGYFRTSASQGTAQLDELWKWDGSNWTFIKGNKGKAYGQYGTQGVANTNNSPGARYDHFQWIDCDDNIWVYGGYGRDYGSGTNVLSDFWKFDGTNWTWISGDTIKQVHPDYGTINVPSTSNNPGSRALGVSFKDNDGNFWLYGGRSDNNRGSQARVNDIWRWSDTAWTWVGGQSNGSANSAKFGNIGEGSTNYWPGGKDHITGAYNVKTAKLLTIGGFGREGNSGYHNVLWEISSGEFPAPKIQVFGNSTRITNSQTTTSTTDSTSFGSVHTMSTDSIRFMVVNPGTQYLSFNQWPRLTITGTHATDFSYDENMIGGVQPGDTAYFKLYFAPGDTGVRNATVSWKTNITKPKNDTFTFNISGYGVCPVVNPTTMDVYGAGTATLYNGDTASAAKRTALDAANTGGTSSRTFYIKNTGSTNLVLANAATSDLYGVFSVATAPTNSVAPGDSTVLVVEFSPTIMGSYSGQVTFSSNTCPDSVFTFSISALASCDTSVSNIQWAQVGSNIYETEGSGYFAREVDLSEDGKRAVIGTPSYSNSSTRQLGYGQMFEYNENTQTWEALGKPVYSLSMDSTGNYIRGNRDGTSIAISGDGKRMAVGGRDHRDYRPNTTIYGYMVGGVNVYEYDANQDSMIKVGQTLYGSDGSYFGWDVELSNNGNTLVVGAQRGDSLFNNSGYVRVYDYANNKWVLRGEAISGVASSDEFGTSVSVSDDGNTVAAGADYNDDVASSSGHVRIFTWSGSAWVQKGSTLRGLYSGDRAGSAVSLSANGNIVALGEKYHDLNDQVSSGDPGKVRVFEFKNNDWSQMGDDFVGSFDGDDFDSEMGNSVALSNSGKRIVISEQNKYDVGAVSIYDYDGTQWNMVGCEITGTDNGEDFGHDIAISGNGSTIIIGNERSSSYDSAYAQVYFYDNSPKISIAVDSNVTCNGLANGGATATVTNGTAPYKFSWSSGDTTLSADSLSAGTYTFRVIDAAQDTVMDSIVITEPAKLVAASVVDNNVSCNGLSDGGATGSASGGTTPYTYTWSNAATAASITSVSAGTYTVTITDANGCSATANSTVTEPAALQATAAIDSNVTCNGLLDGGVSVSGSGGTTPYTYLWSNAATTASITSLSAGTYTITVSDANGCTVSDQKAVTEPTALSLSTAVDSNVTCNGLSDGGVTASATGGTTPYTYTWSNSATTASITSVSAGTYSVTLTDANGCTATSSKTVTQPTLLVAGVIDGDTTVCSGTAPNKLRIGSATSGGVSNYTYQWQMSTDSTKWTNVTNATSADYQPLAVAGNTWYRRLDSDGNSCGPDTTNVLKVGVFAQPNAGFRATTACEGKQTNFTDTTTLAFGKIQSYFWSFGDQGTSNQQNPINIYKSSGTYTVKLDIVADGGCNSSVVKTVSVNDMPTVDFTASVECEGTATDFTNKSSISNGTNSYSWNLGDNNSSSSTSPSHSYTNSGYYTVQLTATSNNGCVDSISKTVQVKQVAKPNFSATSVCEGQTTNFTNLSTNASTYSWDFDDNGNGSKQANPKNKYKNSGSYTVVLTATSADGCSDTAQRTVSVYSLPTAGFTGTEVCLGQSTVFTNTSSGASKYQWIFDNGTSSTASAPSLVYGQAGNYKVELTATTANGCVDVATNTITVNALPSVSFTTADVCQSDALTTVNTTTGANSYSWSFGDGNTSALRSPTHNYSTHGQYRVKLEASTSKGCVDSSSTTINAWAEPRVAFNASNVCLGHPMTFNNTSSIATGSMTYNWSLGDGSSTGNASPVKTYGNFGPYAVQLVATTNRGCKDSITSTVTVYNAPTIDFDAPNVCFADTLKTLNKSIISSSYTWNLGDGQTSAAQDTVNIYSKAGDYTIQLIGTTAEGCMDSISKQVTIYPKPIAGFDAKDECDQTAVSFANTSYNANITSHNWSYGDGNNSQVINPNHTYTKEGSYTAQLITISDNGCADTLSKTITVHPNPVVSFTNTTECDYDSTRFTNNTSIVTGSNTYQWNLGTGASSTDANPVYHYPQSGSYVVSLQATSDQGCTKTTQTVVVVNPSPMASLMANHHCEGLATQMASLSTVSTGSIAENNWDMGDGSTSTDATPTHLYATDGDYTIELVVKTDQSCYDTTSTVITVYNKPEADFSTPDVCFGVVSAFTDATVDGQEYLYDFGDKWGISTLAEPDYTYEAPGAYNPILYVTSSNGCKDTVTKSIEIYSLPTAQFSINHHCFGEDFTPQDQSQGNVSDWSWEYEDGNTSADQNPTHQYGKDGSYNVKLQVEDNNGCTDSLRKTVVVWPLPVVGVRTDTLVSKGYTVPMLATGGVEYKWSPVDNLDKPLKANPTATVIEDVTYTVTVANQFGCTRDTFVNLKVREDYTLEPSNIMTPDGNGQNDAWIVEKAQYYNDVEVLVFDRWGRIVYQSNSYNNSWEGTGTNGEPLPDGAYYYVVKVPADREEYKGSITIFR